MVKPLIEEFVERRIYSCRHCHGNGQMLMTPAEYAKAKQAHNSKRAKKIAAGKADIGDFPPAVRRYEAKKPPNPECPKCHGEGIKKTLLRDTRTLTPRGLYAFAGVKLVNGRAFVMYWEDGVIREVSEA